MINNLNNRMVTVVKNKIAECYRVMDIKSLQMAEDKEEVSKISIDLSRKFFNEVILKFENDMFDYFDTNYKASIRFGYEIIRKNHLFNVVGDDAQEIDSIKSKGYRHYLECCPTLKLFEFYDMIDDFIDKLYEE
mgnify:CR=1 FL=1